MLVYWLLLSFPAIMALTYPEEKMRHGGRNVEFWALPAFALIYALVGGVRENVGGDWISYQAKYDDIRFATLTESLEITDPLFGLLNLVSAQFDAGVYLVNGVCCLLLGYGTILVAKQFREPWLAVLIAVPYLLIVVGFGYVRQAAAIGLILMAIASLDRERPALTIACVVLAAGFHSTAVFSFPFVALAIGKKHRIFALLGAIAAVIVYQMLVVPRMQKFEIGYIGGQYDSSGAFIRIMMGVIPSALILFFRKRFWARQQARTAWLSIAVANLVVLAALTQSSSSTAIDRIGLYFSIIQLAAFGEFRDLAAVSPRNVPLVRMGLVGIAFLVQLVWLVFADHSAYWVPYRSILQSTDL